MLVSYDLLEEGCMVQKSGKRLHTFTGYTKLHDTILAQVSCGNV